MGASSSAVPPHTLFTNPFLELQKKKVKEETCLGIPHL